MRRTEEDQELFEALSASKMYSGYRDAFAKATGLPLILHQGCECQLGRHSNTEQHPFCTPNGAHQKSLHWCYKLQSKLELQSGSEAQNLYCFAGLLQDPHLRISEVAFDVGFQSLSHFNRSFRRIEGQSPKQYRAAMAKSLR
jgi:hypothetical protein